MAEAVVAILKSGHLNFSMLGSDEKNSGAPPRMLGEEGLFLEMVEHNTRLFKEHNVTSIICFSPHDYDVFIGYYKGIEEIEVKHYSQIIYEMIQSGTIEYKKRVRKKVVYHDPCYLGRQHNIYEEPRRILESIPGIELVEMRRSRETALCCGGGGSGLFLDLPRVNMDKARADHIREASADCIAVACPHCCQMLDSAIRGLGYDIEVRDIAQLVREAL